MGCHEGGMPPDQGARGHVRFVPKAFEREFKQIMADETSLASRPKIRDGHPGAVICARGKHPIRQEGQVRIETAR